MHAIHFFHTDFQGKYGMPEHYFDTEALPEIGYSYEQAVSHSHVFALRTSLTDGRSTLEVRRGS